MDNRNSGLPISSSIASTPIQSEARKAEELWNIWFTVNQITEFTSNLGKELDQRHRAKNYPNKYAAHYESVHSIKTVNHSGVKNIFTANDANWAEQTLRSQKRGLLSFFIAIRQSHFLIHSARRPLAMAQI